jgi:hypothetical protein
LGAAALLFAFAQAININHGGTPGMSRYAVWLIPLAVAVLPKRRTIESTHELKRERLLWGAAIVSAIWSIAFFRPSLPDQSLVPTRLALYQWTHYPGLLNPVPEIFAERLRHQDGVNTLAATPDCEKVLIQSGQWPDPCRPQSAPWFCVDQGAHCYANRTARRDYRYVRVERRGGWRLIP